MMGATLDDEQLGLILKGGAAGHLRLLPKSGRRKAKCLWH